MCGRYLFSTEEHKEFRQIVRNARQHSGQSGVEPRFPIAGDIAPTAVAPVLVAGQGKVTAQFQRWGIHSPRGNLVINARAETVCDKAMFRCSIAARRCVIPASGYYEWDAGKHKCLFRRTGSALYMAGIYDDEEEENRFVVLTTAPNDTVRGIHDRMPLILTHEQVRPWLTDPQAALQLLTQVPPDLEHTVEDGQLRLGDFL